MLIFIQKSESQFYASSSLHTTMNGVRSWPMHSSESEGRSSCAS